MICNYLQQCINNESQQNTTHACPNNNHASCIESADRRREVKCEENHKKYILVNTLNRYVISYKMDGGIIVVDRTVPNGTNKCDYLYTVFTESNTRDAVLIELKGKDIPKALDQIKSTLQLFPDVFRTCTHVYGRIVVTSSFPNLKSRPEYVNLSRTLAGIFHGNLKIYERQYTEKDVELSNPQR